MGFPHKVVEGWIQGFQRRGLRMLGLGFWGQFGNLKRHKFRHLVFFVKGSDFGFSSLDAEVEGL